MSWLIFCERLANIFAGIALPILAYYTFHLGKVANRQQIDFKKGIKTVDCKFVFSQPSDLNNHMPSFLFTAKNNSSVSHTLSLIKAGKEDICLFFVKKEKDGTLSKIETILKTGDVIPRFIHIDKDFLRKLEKANGVFLYDNIDNKTKILSKRGIRKQLRRYYKYMEQKNRRG